LLQSAKSNDKLQSNIANLKSQNVAFSVCANTLKGKKLNPGKDLYDVFEEDIVPSGVAELSPPSATRVHLHKTLIHIVCNGE
jgi:intracellular sulfur oxidation DsrE/DsrF family protein